MNEAKIISPPNKEILDRITKREKPKPGELPRKILKEKIGEHERAEYFFAVKNEFHNTYPEQEPAELSVMHPQIVGKLPEQLGQNSRLAVRYVDRQGRLVEEQWPLSEYLRRIGFKGDDSAPDDKSPLGQFKHARKNEQDLPAYLRDYHEHRVRGRNQGAYRFEQKLIKEAESDDKKRKARIQQLKSQFHEDPEFSSTINRSGFMHSAELPITHDYFDAIDVLLEAGDDKDPVYLGVQRTLAQPGSQQHNHKYNKLTAKPIWFLPEYPERNPVLRVLYSETKEEYYDENFNPLDPAVLDKGGEHAMAKSLDVLLEAMFAIKMGRRRVNKLPQDVRLRHEKYYEKYERVVSGLIKQIGDKLDWKEEDYKENIKNILHKSNEQ